MRHVVDGGHVILGDREIENVGILCDPGRCDGFRQRKNFVLQTPTNAELGNRFVVFRRDRRKQRVCQQPAASERTPGFNEDGIPSAELHGLMLHLPRMEFDLIHHRRHFGPHQGSEVMRQEVGYADGTDAPRGCRIASFTTIDLTGRWQATPKLEVFASIQNLFDKIAPLDPTTYGAVNYNPMHYSGAVGRYFTVGIRYEFD